MTGHIFRIRRRPVTWGVLGVAVSALAVMTVYGLESRYAGYVAGGLLITCLNAWVAACFFGGQGDRGEFDGQLRMPTHTQRRRS